MTPALRLLPLRAVAARPLTSRSSARAFSTTLQRKQDDKGEAQSWNQAIHEINKSVSLPGLTYTYRLLLTAPPAPQLPGRRQIDHATLPQLLSSRMVVS